MQHLQRLLEMQMQAQMQAQLQAAQLMQQYALAGAGAGAGATDVAADAGGYVSEQPARDGADEADAGGARVDVAAAAAVTTDDARLSQHAYTCVGSGLGAGEAGGGAHGARALASAEWLRACASESDPRGLAGAAVDAGGPPPFASLINAIQTTADVALGAGAGACYAPPGCAPTGFSPILAKSGSHHTFSQLGARMVTLDEELVEPHAESVR